VRSDGEGVQAPAAPRSGRPQLASAHAYHHAARVFRRYIVIAAVACSLAFAGGWLLRGHARSIIDAKGRLQVNALDLTPAAIPAGYAAIPCPPNAFTIAVFGQSNAMNSVRPLRPRQFPSQLVQYDWRSDRCYRYREPLLGAEGVDGNAISYAAEAVLNAKGGTVLVVPFAAGGTSVSGWNTGPLMHIHRLVLRRLLDRRIVPSVFLWHQGEADASTVEDQAIVRRLFAAPYFTSLRWDQLPISSGYYSENLRQIVSRTYRAFPSTRFGIALVSRCDGDRRAGNPLVRSAQQAVALEDHRSFVSANSDAIDANGDRYDGCHFSEQGARKLAAQYASTMLALR